jgi:inner membrane protease ATP23
MAILSLDENFELLNKQNGNGKESDKMKSARSLMEKIYENNCSITLSLIECDLRHLYSSASLSRKERTRYDNISMNEHGHEGSKNEPGDHRATTLSNSSGTLSAEGVRRKVEDEKKRSLVTSAFTNVMGGYNSLTKELKICSNLPQDIVESTIVHELIHAYDDCRGQLKSAENIACSEIRAAHLSGDCDLLQELFRGRIPNPFKLQDHLKACVKRRAHLSLNMNPHCSDGSAENEKLISKVFDRCFQDKL